MNRIVCSRMALVGYMSNFHKTLSGYDFLPVCRYPVGWEVEDYEQGALVRLRDEEVIEVYGKLICR